MEVHLILNINTNILVTNTCYAYLSLLVSLKLLFTLHFLNWVITVRKCCCSYNYCHCSNNVIEQCFVIIITSLLLYPTRDLLRRPKSIHNSDYIYTLRLSWSEIFSILKLTYDTPLYMLKMSKLSRRDSFFYQHSYSCVDISYVAIHLSVTRPDR